MPKSCAWYAARLCRVSVFTGLHQMGWRFNTGLPSLAAMWYLNNLTLNDLKKLHAVTPLKINVHCTTSAVGAGFKSGGAQNWSPTIEYIMWDVTQLPHSSLFCVAWWAQEQFCINVAKTSNTCTELYHSFIQYTGSYFFGSGLPSSGSFLDSSDLLEMQIE
jgi:hypothetical protein